MYSFVFWKTIRASWNVCQYFYIFLLSVSQLLALCGYILISLCIFVYFISVIWIVISNLMFSFFHFFPFPGADHYLLAWQKSSVWQFLWWALPELQGLWGIIRDSTVQGTINKNILNRTYLVKDFLKYLVTSVAQLWACTSLLYEPCNKSLTFLFLKE